MNIRGRKHAALSREGLLALNDHGLIIGLIYITVCNHWGMRRHFSTGGRREE